MRKIFANLLYGPASAAYASGASTAGSGSITTPSISTIAKSQVNATVFTCADLISKAIAQANFTCEEKHWDKAFREPNLFQSEYEFWYGVSWDASIFGNMLMHRSEGTSGRQGVLAPFDLEKMEIKGSMAGPRYRLTGESQELDPETVIHIRHGGGNSLEALGRVAGGWSRVKALNAADGEIDDVFSNGLNIRYLLHGGYADEGTLKKMLKSIQAGYGKSGNKRGSVVGLMQGFKLDAFKNPTPADSDLRGLRVDLIREIAALFGVPPFAVGGSSDTKYANVTARHQQTNQQALMPLATNIAQKMSVRLRAEVTFDEMKLIKGDFGSLIEQALQAAGGPVMTPNEARKKYLDMDPLDSGSELRDPQTQVNIGSGDRRGENDPDGSESDR